MTWTGQSFSVGQELTAAQMTNLQADITAHANGDSGAPKQQLAGMGSGSVDTTQIVAAAVGRSQIANSTATSAGSIASAATLGFVLNDWALFPMIHGEGIAMSVQAHSSDGGSASSPRFRLSNGDGSTRAYDVDHRWILAA